MIGKYFDLNENSLLKLDLIDYKSDRLKLEKIIFDLKKEVERLEKRSNELEMTIKLLNKIDESSFFDFLRLEHWDRLEKMVKFMDCIDKIKNLKESDIDCVFDLFLCIRNKD